MKTKYQTFAKLAMICFGSGIVLCIQQSCSPVSPVGLAVGAGATVIHASQSEKGLKKSAEDLRTRAEVLHYLFQKNVTLFSSVNVSVENARVLLTGAVNRPMDRINATKLAWKATGVREVINELQVQNTSSIANSAKDLLINKALQTQLLLDKNIKFINYSVDTVNGIVYLFGIAENQEELDRVIDLARNTNYVEDVVNYVTLE
ncbi:MAG: hypothetical protein CMM58_02640 [Rhodospirillaceae bacterium]|nr:hypothetical protein [Rhodospirillaceae bacterium]|tara:strand:- start:1300 stop:1911 length:612 start_codon:yes stop_codon:yes gene_type:complete